MHTHRPVLLALLLALSTACGDDSDDDGGGAATDAPTSSTEEPAGATRIDVTAVDYGFEVPATFDGGVVEVNFKNAGAEPHFAAFTRPTGDATLDDVKAALTAPPSDTKPPGPPPFEEVAGVATTDPGGGSTVSFILEPGSYALYCAIPSPDGVAHTAKGMITEVTVGEARGDELPEAGEEVITVDFAFNRTPAFVAGDNTVSLANQGKQIHEVDVAQLAEGKSVEDVVAWFAAPDGPPPARLLGGPFVEPGGTAIGTVTLEAGWSYMLLCVIPDFLGDFAPHATKGMYTEAFTVE